MDFLPLAFLMGLLGSLHCAVMCGPIMLSFPIQTRNDLNALTQFFLYQLGRILIYTLLGLLVGLVGHSLKVFSNQKTLSLTIGLLLVLFAFLQLNSRYRNKLSGYQARMFSPLGKLMFKVYHKPYWGLFAGMVNGLIPCGMVYLALATALNSGSISAAAKFMFLFGLGTAPLMLMVSLGGIYLKKYIRFNTQKLVPWFMVFMGILFMLRASDLGIPFLSPKTTNVFGQTIECK